MSGGGVARVAASSCLRRLVRCRTRPVKARGLATSSTDPVVHMRVGPSVTVSLVPSFEDNYAYLVRDAADGTMFAVDAADSKAAIAAVDAAQSPTPLIALLTTHKHWDHAGGNKAMARAFPGLDVYGPAPWLETEDVPALTHGLSDGDTFTLGAMGITAIHTPCHTRGHLMYFLERRGHAPVLFSGDMLFAGGCGRFFEGTAEDMFNSLEKVVNTVPSDTLIFCGHEYTLGNLMFAVTVDAANQQLQQRLKTVQQLRAEGKPTIPSSMALELDTNPFLRVQTEAVAASVGLQGAGPVEVMAEVRARKDSWKPT